MNKSILFGAMIMACTVTLSVSVPLLIDKGPFWPALLQPTPTLPAVVNKQYENECGACHFAYQPGWLPARSWQRMMGSLDDHFDENAELSQKVHDKITEYLIDESADVRSHRKSHSILASVREHEAPLRISRLSYILYKHEEIPSHMISGNASVRSSARCLACHPGASKGRFDENDVNIPGYGLWEE